MIYRIMADVVLALHFGFILFVIFGGLLAIRKKRMIFIHLPAAVWGAYVELTGSICPLTDIENIFRIKAGEAGYSGSFIEHYLIRIIYPDGLTHEIQYVLAALVVFINSVVYLLLFKRHKGK